MSSNHIALLALDGGGVRGLSQLDALDEIMGRLQWDEAEERNVDVDDVPIPKPCERFSLIGGSGTGGLIAMLLGPLGFSVQEAKETYHHMIRIVFPMSNRLPSGTFDPLPLECFLKDLIKRTLGDENAMLLDSSRQDLCKSPYNLSRARIVRSYGARSNAFPNCPIWKAIRATMAAPDFLPDIELGDKFTPEKLIDGGFRWNNPVNSVLSEAKFQFPSQRLTCLLNLGTGHPGVIRLGNDISQEQTLRAIVRDCDKAAEEMTKASKDMVSDEETILGSVPDKPPPRNPAFVYGKGPTRTPSFYFRLSAQQGMQTVQEEDWNSEAASRVITFAKQDLLLHDVTSRVDAICWGLRGFGFWITLRAP
ncbi:acyl transferase/acyl hydrolase/lysophospholipase [Flagelloscypha sp. PMI_526]|nr:acyl transferase/acyl hydrolase/lysophospholipase [Flagelloscypha sp. PMI_526]